MSYYPTERVLDLVREDLSRKYHGGAKKLDVSELTSSMPRKRGRPKAPITEYVTVKVVKEKKPRKKRTPVVVSTEHMTVDELAALPYKQCAAHEQKVHKYHMEECRELVKKRKLEARARKLEADKRKLESVKLRREMGTTHKGNVRNFDGWLVWKKNQVRPAHLSYKEWLKTLSAEYQLYKKSKMGSGYVLY